MGACFSHCLSTVTDSISYRFYHRHTSMSYREDDQEQFLNEEDDINESRRRKKVPVTLELKQDRAWSRFFNKYAKLNSRSDLSTSSRLDSPLRVLDARVLMNEQPCVSPTPGSSLDLEWEHEATPLPIPLDDISSSTSNKSQPSSLTASPWSRMSTSNSLEWDPVEADMVCVDVETVQLLDEIQRLTDKALKETGEWTENS